MNYIDFDDAPVTREGAAAIIRCSIHLVNRHIANGVLRAVATGEDGKPRFSTQDCVDLYRGSMRGRRMVFGPHPSVGT